MTVFWVLSQVIDHHPVVGSYCHTHLIDARIISLHFTPSKANQHCTDFSVIDNFILLFQVKELEVIKLKWWWWGWGVGRNTISFPDCK